MITKKRKNIEMVKYIRFRQYKWTESNVIKMFENMVTNLLHLNVAGKNFIILVLMHYGLHLETKWKLDVPVYVWKNGGEVNSGLLPVFYLYKEWGDSKKN